MMSNVPNTTDTTGNIRDRRTLYSGQENTFQYSDSERGKLFKDRPNKQLGQRWDDPALGQILTQDNGVPSATENTDTEVDD